MSGTGSAAVRLAAFRPAGFTALADAARLTVGRVWSDPVHLFSVYLLQA